MIGIASINETSPAASSSPMPSRTPVALSRKTFDCWHDTRLSNPRYHRVLGTPPTYIDHAVAKILLTLAFADHKIPIAPRSC
jgi:hypothetical protein